MTDPSHVILPPEPSTAPVPVMAILKTTSPTTLMGSRKFKALLLATILMGVLFTGASVAVATGHGTWDQLIDFAKWLVGSLATITAVFIGAVAAEDAAKSP